MNATAIIDSGAATSTQTNGPAMAAIFDQGADSIATTSDSGASADFRVSWQETLSQFEQSASTAQTKAASNLPPGNGLNANDPASEEFEAVLASDADAIGIRSRLISRSEIARIPGNPSGASSHDAHTGASEKTSSSPRHRAGRAESKASSNPTIVASTQAGSAYPLIPCAAPICVRLTSSSDPISNKESQSPLNGSVEVSFDAALSMSVKSTVPAGDTRSLYGDAAQAGDDADTSSPTSSAVSSDNMVPQPLGPSQSPAKALADPSQAIQQAASSERLHQVRIVDQPRESQGPAIAPPQYRQTLGSGDIPAPNAQTISSDTPHTTRVKSASAAQSPATSAQSAFAAHTQPFVNPTDSQAMAHYDRSIVSSTRTEAQTHTVASSSASDAFAALDNSDTMPATTWIHAGARHAEAGYLDPSLGWVGVRAESSGTAVHAAIVTGSTDAARTLDGHLAGLNSFVTEHHGHSSTVTLASPDQNHLASGSGQSGQQAPQQRARESLTRENKSTREVPTSASITARSDPQSDREARTPYAPAGAHISVIA